MQRRFYATGKRKREPSSQTDKNAAGLWGGLWASVLYRGCGPNVHPLRLLLIVLGTSIPSWAGLLFAMAGVVAFGWVSVMAARLRAELFEGGQARQKVSWATK